ncbi:neuropeptide FF receptor 2-like [Patiria miniata]|uniref:G-protein coupled receptors family 1 profile domain-containing protein n=1 Tax=Patiria miniata TaxID=46514 RepID=A0A914AAV1_PATMI|nr:neuropeptide FF receptor 2-like [Patiria miniata]
MAYFTTSLPYNSWNDCVGVTNITETFSTPSSDGRFGLRTLCLSVEAFGIVVNSAFLFVVYRHKPLHNVTNIYLANLAVADIMVLVFGVVATILNTSSYRPVEWVGCAYQVAVTLSYFSESILSGDGCRILQPPRKLVNSETSAEICRLIYQEPRRLFHSDLVKVLPFFILLIFNVVVYSRIIRALRRSFLIRHSKSNRQQVISSPRWIKNIRRSRVRITRMLAINTIVFFSCNLMMAVLVIASYIQNVLGTELRFLEDDQATVYSYALLLFNSSINPLVYVLTNESYRQGFWDAFMPCWRHPKPVNKPAVFNLQII